jgi:hypothetical protein
MTTDRGGCDQAFFSVLAHTDLWGIMRKFMYVNKRKSNIYDYRSGDMAAFYGYIEILKLNKKLSFTTDAMDMASRTGYLETVKWLHENRTEGCTQDAMDGASHFGYIEIIK